MAKINKFNKKIALGGGVILVSIVAIAFIFNAQKPTVSTIDVPYTRFAPDVVKGNIVTLKKLREEYFIDFHNMFSIKVREPFESPKHITLDYTIRILRYIMSLCDKGETLYYVIFDNKDDKLIGAIEIREKNEIDPGQLGCWINENYWGGGRIQEAYRLISDVYFNLKPDEQSYEAQVRVWNKRSYKALKKFGFVDVEIKSDPEGKADRHVLKYHRNSKK
ncbi:GNAT family N-acetyltransferase [Candidatus Dependentiae bacterium]|nr:GNAT family N-acetyltransferase [Candidatus Dependentiae bacterium]